MKNLTIDLTTVAKVRCSLCSNLTACAAVPLDDGQVVVYLCADCANAIWELLVNAELEKKWLGQQKPPRSSD